MRAKIFPAVALLALGGSFPAAAKVVDVGLDGYVTDGLVANWDGVFNVASDTYHDGGATVWADLVGGHDASFKAVTDRTGGMGHWATNGYYFAGASYAQIGTAWNLGSVFTVQIVCDYTVANQAAINYPNYFAAPNDFCIFTQKAGASLQWKTDPAGESTRSKLTSWNGKYITAVFGTNTLYLTQTAAYANAVTRAGTQATGNLLWTIGGSASGPKDRVTIGTIHAVRIYSKQLSEDEMAVNRAQDERRFRNGRANADVVVATDTPGLSGDVPPGTYGVVGEHLFRAPSIVQTNGTTYALLGYRLETWDKAAKAWSNAVTSFDSTYRHVADETTVRLTWLWSSTGGLQRYQATDYVQPGLKAQFDGVRNVAYDAAHAPDPELWHELVSDGAITASFVANTNDFPIGEWTADGFAFDGGGYAKTDSNLPALGMACTVQVTLDCNTSAQTGIRYSNFISYTAGDNGMFSQNAKVTWKMDGTTGGKWDDPPAVRAEISSGWAGKYLTGIITPTEIGLFQTATTNGVTFQQRTKFNEVLSDKWLIGGAVNSNDGGTEVRCCRANIQSVRLYDRVLSNDELALNRDVDEVRFRGAYPASDGVVVATSLEGAEGVEPSGLYRLYGTYAFSAPVKLKIGGEVYRAKGSTVETWNESTGVWEGAAWQEGRTRTLQADGSRRRLTWSWAPCGMKFIIR